LRGSRRSGVAAEGFNPIVRPSDGSASPALSYTSDPGPSSPTTLNSRQRWCNICTVTSPVGMSGHRNGSWLEPNCCVDHFQTAKYDLQSYQPRKNWRPVNGARELSLNCKNRRLPLQMTRHLGRRRLGRSTVLGLMGPCWTCDVDAFAARHTRRAGPSVATAHQRERV
jgi:hypothetical protein